LKGKSKHDNYQGPWGLFAKRRGSLPEIIDIAPTLDAYYGIEGYRETNGTGDIEGEA
jgi:hypothetical protein